ncbi:zinc metalloprotease [Luteibaculum oceani]|uniref:Membrane metalloprotease n=1 Tax=Luteibaculum oceani TaxID=1294296 RepID=A0A5C6VB72_9FLAO|nr:zinc-dependent metalloprotease family protein [Luteibaculum oceani]TXC82154.1 hypothetical protein FRX97_03405 [Luteibaculum oceani]
MTINLKKLSLYSLIALITIIVSCDKTNLGPSSTNQSAGKFANEILSDSKYKKLVLEVLYPEGFSPNQQSLNNLTDFINQFANKPDGITVKERVIPAFSKSELTVTDIKNFEDKQRGEYPSGDKLSIFVLFTNTGYSEDTENAKVLGIAYRSTSICLFQKTIQDNSSSSVLDQKPSKTTLETTVLNHELGHLFGLVNNGTDMVDDHQDREHGAHCTTEDCLMFFQAETSANLGNLMGGNIPQLDAFCRNDISANGGK